MGKNIHARENIKKKIRAKRKAKKKFMQNAPGHFHLVTTLKGERGSKLNVKIRH